MRIYRGIALNENDSVNTNELGISWSLDVTFAENHAKSISSVRGTDGYIVLEAVINEDVIDMNNTLFAMENRPNEYEIVLIDGTELASYVELTTIDSIEQYAKVGGIATTSTTFEDYTNSYDGDLTENDLIELVNEF
jgi:hypothetical protein